MNEKIVILSQAELEDTVIKAVEKAMSGYMRNTAEIPEYMTRNEAALLFKISLSTLHRNVKAGKLKIYKFGRRSLLKTSEVQNAVEEKLIIKYARRKEQR